jgi:hypothetical protein
MVRIPLRSRKWLNTMTRKNPLPPKAKPNRRGKPRKSGINGVQGVDWKYDEHGHRVRIYHYKKGR